MKKIVHLGWVCALAMLSACAADVGDVDRTQPGKLKKSIFESEWHYRQTVIGVPFTSGVTFIGEQSSLERVRWEISEDHLTAYRSYERVHGSETPSQLPGTEYQGAPIAAFAITSHFDVQRIYNDATGEQTNVVVEDSSDLPWYDREYIRVDWSQNLLANFEFIAGGSSGLGVRSQSASYAVTDPDSPDAPVFGVQTRKGWKDYRDPFEWGTLDSVDYFDITQKIQVTPDFFPIYYDDGSFEQWPACWFYEYGPWDCASQTVKIRAAFLKAPPSDYEPLYYPDNYVARDENGQAIRTTWDQETGHRRCTSEDSGDLCTTVRVPMFDWFGYFRRERESYDRERGVTEAGRLFYADRFNLWKASTDKSGARLPYAEREVKKIQYYLSENFPTELTAAAMEVGSWWNQPFADTVNALRGDTDAGVVFEILPNTYAAKNGKITNFGQRNGDLRYSHLYWVDNPQFESLLGYGPNSPDPLTGEVIAGSAYVYGAAIDTYAAYGADTVELGRGTIDEDQFIEGEHVGPALAAMRNAAQPDRGAMERDVQQMMDSGLETRLKSVKDRGPAAYRSTVDHTKARLAKADRAGLGDALWNNEMRSSLERRFGRRLKLSEFAAGRLAKAYNKHRMNLAKHKLDFRAFDDAGVLALIEEFDGLEREEIVQKIRAYLFKAVAAHEIGHTLGLRHNFAGSADALNYHDHYWDVRNPAAKTLDLPTRDEMKQGVREYAYSSIMDYGARVNSDIRGIGKYDRAAIKFGYGQLVEAFVTPPSWEKHDALKLFNLDQVILEDWIHYTDLPDLFRDSVDTHDGLQNMRARENIPMSDVIAWMTRAPGAEEFSDSLVPYRFCSDEYMSARWDCQVWDEGADPYEMNHYRAQTYRDHYIFDAFKRHRRYLDPFEYYYGVYYRVMEPMATQYHLWLYDQWNKASTWSWMASMNTTATENPDWNLDPHGGLAGTAAAMSAMNFFVEVIGTPEPGSYYTDPTTGVLTNWTDERDTLCRDGQDSFQDSCSDLYIPLGAGRYAESEFDAVSGYYWFEKIRVVGSFWEKLAAVEIMSNPSTYLLGVDDIADATSYNLGFNVAFPHAVSNIFGGVINNDYRLFAPSLGDDGQLKRPTLFASPQAASTDVITQTPAGKIIDPSTNFTTSLYTMFYGMALLNSNYDQSFNDNAKIWLSGSGEAITPLPGSVQITFNSPFNQRSYQAVKSPDALHYSLGYEMLNRAEKLKTTITTAGADCFTKTDGPCAPVQGHKWELQNLMENVEVIRGYYDIFGYAWF